MARVIVVEPWYGGSHRVWLDGWQSHSRHRLHPLTLPDRFWRWRMRGGAVALAQATTDWIAEHGRPDAVVVSGLVDAAGYCGLARHALAGVPIALYMHENQVLYPLAPNQRPDSAMGLTNWRSLLAADQVWWNSDFHRRALLEALPPLLASQPEPPDPRSLAQVADRSAVLWPGVDTVDLIAAPKPRNQRPLVLWNQRWDHDKNPRAVFTALRAVANDGTDFGLALAGENQQHADELAWVKDNLGAHLEHEGWLEPAAYRELLARADVVVSAADHEFFGIAIVEAIAAGAVPVLPDRLSFPELVGSWAPAALYPDGELRQRLGQVLRDVDAAQQSIEGLRTSMARFDVAASASAHDDAVDALLQAGQSNP